MKRSERTCCVCRSKGGKQELARLVFFEGALMWDELQRAPGRGVYVHLTAECLSKMSNVTRWERSLRLPPGTVQGTLVAELARAMLAKMLDQVR